MWGLCNVNLLASCLSHYLLRIHTLRLVESFTTCPSAFQPPKFHCCCLFSHFLCPCVFMSVIKFFYCHFHGIWGVRLNACFQSIIIPTWLLLDTLMISLLSLFSCSGFNYVLLRAPCCPETTKWRNFDKVPDRVMTHISDWLVVGAQCQLQNNPF